jgi:Uma2 family endonuclease
MATAASPPRKTGALPTHLDLPCEDDSVSRSFFEEIQAMLLTTVIELWVKQRRPDLQCLAGGDHYIYWENTKPPAAGARAPDWFLVVGVPRLLDGQIRNSYVMWQEKVIPTIVMEFPSDQPGGELDKTPGTGKFWIYEQRVRAPHYVIFDSSSNHLDAYQLLQGLYESAKPNERGHYPIESVGLEYGLWHGEWHGITRLWVRLWDNSGQMLLTPEEAAAQEQTRADQAQNQAEEAERARRKAFDKLRELGFDPDKL